MSNESDMYLTDRMYLEILVKARDLLDKTDKVCAVDSNSPGDKYTETNVGLCNPELITARNSMWPEQFPGRKAMRYKREYHTCPLDRRAPLARGNTDMRSGCFHTCRIFKGSKRSRPSIDEMKELFDTRIAEVRTWFEDGGTGLFMALQENETSATAECGCRLEIGDDGCPRFYMCPEHSDSGRVRAVASTELDTLARIAGSGRSPHETPWERLSSIKERAEDALRAIKRGW